MNFEEYEKKQQTLYAEFAHVVRDILEKAIAAMPGVRLPNPSNGALKRHRI